MNRAARPAWASIPAIMPRGDQPSAHRATWAAAVLPTLKELVAGARRLCKDGLTSDQQIGFEVVETAFTRALEGMALPYGDVAVGSWRNAPYVVIQNVGGYIDMPRFFGSTQPLKATEDVGPYMDRLGEVPAILNGELDRIRAARGIGVVPPAFLLDKAIAQMETSIAGAVDSYAGPLKAATFGAGMGRAAGRTHRCQWHRPHISGTARRTQSPTRHRQGRRRGIRPADGRGILCLGGRRIDHHQHDAR